MSKETILIVDDDQALRSVSSQMLSLVGYETLEAENRDEALEMLLEYPKIRTLVVDLIMPGMSVLEFLDELSKMNSKINIIIASGQSEQGLPEDINRYDFQFLSKPYGIEELKHAISSLSEP